MTCSRAICETRNVGNSETSANGSSWWIVRVFAGDAGRKVLMRGMKPLCAKDAQSFYLAHYGMDASTPDSREAFLERVRRRIARI